MTGKLKLYIGPSGVGKDSQLEGIINKSHRMTTRTIRKNEIDSKEFDNSKSTQGYFVDDEEFKKASIINHKIYGIHKYPNKKSGYLYGFNTEDILNEINRGNDVYEQIIPITPIQELEEKIGRENVERILVLSPLPSIKARLSHREGKLGERGEYNIQHIIEYFKNIDFFDELIYINPKGRPIKEENGTFIDEIIKLIKNDEKKYFEEDFPLFFTKEYLTLSQLTQDYREENITKKEVIDILEEVKERYLSVKGNIWAIKSYPEKENDFFSTMRSAGEFLRTYHVGNDVEFIKSAWFFLKEEGEHETAAKIITMAANAYKKIINGQEPTNIIEKEIRKSLKEKTEYLKLLAKPIEGVTSLNLQKNFDESYEQVQKTMPIKKGTLARALIKKNEQHLQLGPNPLIYIPASIESIIELDMIEKLDIESLTFKEAIIFQNYNSMFKWPFENIGNELNENEQKKSVEIINIVLDSLKSIINGEWDDELQEYANLPLKEIRKVEQIEIYDFFHTISSAPIHRNAFSALQQLSIKLIENPLVAYKEASMIVEKTIWNTYAMIQEKAMPKFNNIISRRANFTLYHYWNTFTADLRGEDPQTTPNVFNIPKYIKEHIENVSYDAKTNFEQALDHARAFMMSVYYREDTEKIKEILKPKMDKIDGIVRHYEQNKEEIFKK